MLVVSVLLFSLAISGWQDQEPSIFVKAAISIVFLFILYFLLVEDQITPFFPTKLIWASIIFALLVLFNPIFPIHINHYLLMAIGFGLGGSLFLFAIAGIVIEMNASEEKEYPRTHGVICGTPLITPMAMEKFFGSTGSQDTMPGFSQKKIIRKVQRPDATDAEILEEIRSMIAKYGACSESVLRARFDISFSRAEKLIEKFHGATMEEKEPMKKDEDRMPLTHKSTLSEALAEERADDLTIPLGREPDGETFFADFFKMPSLLVVGATSSGKSNFLHLILCALSGKLSPDQLKFVLVDPKRSEFGIYKNSPRLMRNVASDPREISDAFRAVSVEIEDRFGLFERERVRNISEYNKGRSDCLPYIFLVVDELSDAMLQEDGAEIRKAIIHATQLGLAVGIFLVLSSSSIKKSVIPEDILATISSVISFRVISKKDSEYILGEPGAEKLSWQGEALIKSSETNYNLIPFMAFPISDEEKLLVHSSRKNG